MMLPAGPAAPPLPPCWICGDPAGTGEHKIKASDLRAVFGPVLRHRPLLLHDDQRLNKVIGGIQAAALKSAARLCAKCNNQRTQPHDRAWQTFAEYLRGRAPLRAGQRIRPGEAFPGTRTVSLLNVHLYFVKLFGCRIVEDGVPLDLRPFSDAILQGKAHPSVHLALLPPFSDLEAVGYSQMDAVEANGKRVFAVWMYETPAFVVRIMFAEPGHHFDGLVNSWHPYADVRCIRVAEH